MLFPIFVLYNIHPIRYGGKSLKCHICSGLCRELTNILMHSFCTVQKGGSQNLTSIRSELSSHWTQHMVCALRGMRSPRKERRRWVPHNLWAPFLPFERTCTNSPDRRLQTSQRSPDLLSIPSASHWHPIWLTIHHSRVASVWASAHLCPRPQDLKIHGN